jgi:hypothetical protein
VLSGVADFVQRRPERAFWTFLALHVTFWAVVPISLHRNPALDLVEAATFGQHWQVLYWKHPPLPWLVVDALRRAFGPQLWPILLAAQLSTALALWAVWRLAREIVPPLPAFVSVALLEGTRSFTYGSEVLNHDLISLPFWALAGWAFWRAVRDGKPSGWALAGLWFGLGCYAKYSIALLLLACSLFLLAEPAGRRRLRTGGPWLAAGIFLIVIAPQFWALATRPVRPFAFAQSHANPITTALDVVWQPADFLVNQLLHLAPLIAVAVLVLARRRDPDAASSPRIDGLARRYVTTIAFAPTALALIVATAAGYGLRWSWGVSFWNFAGLAAVVLLGPGVDRPGVRRLVWALPVIAAVSAVSIVGREAGVSAPRDGPRAQFPGAELARQVASRWARHSDRRLTFVVGDYWVAGNVSFHLPERPHVFVDADPLKTPWIDPEAVRRAGAAIVWRMRDGHSSGLPAQYARLFPEARIESPVHVIQATPVQTSSQSFGVAVALPQERAP